MSEIFGIIVDGYSTGAGLAKEFAERGICCVHVQSQAIIPAVYAGTFIETDYIANEYFTGDIEALATSLKRYAPRFVMAGAECGIELSDALSAALNLPGNSVSLSAHRRHKHLMLEAVARAGIPVIPSCFAATLEDAIVWCAKQNHYPLIAKPVNSAGGEGVKRCDTMNNVINAYLEITSMGTNMLGFEHAGALIQHHIAGEEYVVNLVSHAGKHVLCELWIYTHYQLPNGKQIYDTARIIEFNSAEHTGLVAYAYSVVDALEIKYGPSHVEIIKTVEDYFLVEVGARLMGANLPFSLLSRCLSTPQALMAVESYSTPEQFQRRQASSQYVKQPLVALFMVSHTAGLIETIRYREEIAACESFFAMKLAVKEGGRLQITVDYQTSPGMIYLSHPDPQVIEADRERIRQPESTMFVLRKEDVPDSDIIPTDKKIIAILESIKSNEQRIPIHPAHFRFIKRINPVFFQTGYAVTFDLTDAEIKSAGFFIAERNMLLQQANVIFLLKPMESDLLQMKPGAIVIGWCHAVQRKTIAAIAETRKLTLIAMESMYQHEEHIFEDNNFLSGYLGTQHALAHCPINHPKDCRIALITYGTASQGALYYLVEKGFTNITVFTRRDPDKIPNKILGVVYQTIYPYGSMLYDAQNTLLNDVLKRVDIIINCIKQDVLHPCFFILKDDIKNTRNQLFIDISCDDHMGFDFSSPTTMENPVVAMGNNFYYAIDNIPTLAWESVSRYVSKKLVSLVNGFSTDVFSECEMTMIEAATEIKYGVIVNPVIDAYQAEAALVE